MDVPGHKIVRDLALKGPRRPRAAGIARQFYEAMREFVFKVCVWVEIWNCGKWKCFSGQRSHGNVFAQTVRVSTAPIVLGAD